VEGKTQKLWDGRSGKSFHISDLSRCFSDELKIMEEYGVFYHKRVKNFIANHRSDRGHFEGNIGECA
jgi:hypothetical protein